LKTSLSLTQTSTPQLPPNQIVTGRADLLQMPKINQSKFFKMVTIIGTEQKQNSKGENFIALILQDGLTMVQSKSTGRFYATAQKTSITSTFDEQTAK